MTPDIDAARAEAAKVFEVCGTLPGYCAMMHREGAEGPGDLAVVGTEDRVAAQIHGIIASGATEFVGALFTGDDFAAHPQAARGTGRLSPTAELSPFLDG
ncbi:hypothetical protein [Nocardia sp. NPDC050710]|uniref:hypothetical protein n=1 Tax=Nocardia sp. NPDC050710 TaxID=3157220 RepID=UPI0033F78874